jgi:ubiquinone/menaquinone biosynthesis C-methylase UbiE
MRARLERRIAAAAGSGTGGGGGIRRVEVASASLESLPWDASSFDAVVGMLVLCSVADASAALAEIHRVLRPGGALVFLEHVAAEREPGRLRWQRRIEPLWRRIAGNCHLTRRTADTIRAAGFMIEREQRESIRKAMPLVRPSVRGVARRP